MKLTLTILGAALLAATAPAQTYNFTIDPARTWTDGSVVLRFYTAGTMVGNYDASTNPNGTRTKPGLSGTFGATENVPVPVFPFLQLGGTKKLNSSGTFRLDMDPPNHAVRLSGYSVDRLNGGVLPIGTTIALNNDAFRTRNPLLVLPDHLPALRMGLFNIVSLHVSQHALSNTGVLVQVGAGKWRAIVTFMADVAMDVTQFGQTQPVVFTVPYSLVGNIQVVGSTATFSYGPGTGGENVSVNLNEPLDPFELALPFGTGLTPGFKFALTLKKASVSISGVRQFYASSN